VEVSLSESALHNITVTVSAAYSRRAPSQQLFNYGGLLAYLLIGAAGRDVVVFSSGGPNCTVVAALLADAGASCSSWPPQVYATLLFTVGANGGIAVPTISGVALQLLSSDTEACVPTHFSTQALLNGDYFSPPAATTMALFPGS